MLNVEQVASTQQTTKTKKKKNYILTEIKRNKVAYAYIAPFYILFAIFGVFPLFAGMYVSFFRWDGISPMRFHGFNNYINLMNDRLFWVSLQNTAFIGIIAHIPILFGGLVLAYILNSKIVKGENIWKSFYFLPVVTSSVAVSIVFQNMFGYNFGVVNYILGMAGIDPIGWLIGNGEFINIAVIIMFSWRWIGWNMVIYLAGMQGISHDLYEAARIDGANHVHTFLRITMPLLKPVIVFTLIQSTIGTLNLFTEPFVLTGGSFLGGPNNQGMTVMMYLLSRAPMGGTVFGYASAVAYAITIIAMVISLILLWATNDDRKIAKEGRH